MLLGIIHSCSTIILAISPLYFGPASGDPVSVGTTPDNCLSGNCSDYPDFLSPGAKAAVTVAIIVAVLLPPILCCWWFVRWSRRRRVREAERQIFTISGAPIVEQRILSYNTPSPRARVSGSSPPPDYNEYASFPTVNFNEKNNISFDTVTETTDLPPPSFDEATRNYKLESSQKEPEQHESTRRRKKWKAIISRIITTRN